MIYVENLTRYYDNFCAVDKINFNIKKGEILGILGPNGAGKTTTLRMLTGFLKPSSGTIKIKDLLIDENPLEIKKIMGYLPESAPLYHDMLVYDYLNFVADIRDMDKEKKIKRIKEISNLCGLSAVMHRSISELSKGYKQRVGLAHAMMSDPEILILDEPTSGLDPNQIVEIREIIKQIGKQKTIILSTHILSEAEATCDRIVIINQGKIVADATTEELKQSASNMYNIHILLKNAQFDAVKDSLYKIEGISEVALTDKDDNSLNVKIVCKTSLDIRGNVYNKIKSTDWIILDFHKETKSLENIFRELTKEN